MKRSKVRVVYPRFPVICTRCGWKGTRTYTNIRPCPGCKNRTVRPIPKRKVECDGEEVGDE